MAVQLHIHLSVCLLAQLLPAISATILGNIGCNQFSKVSTSCHLDYCNYLHCVASLTYDFSISRPPWTCYQSSRTGDMATRS